MPPKTRSALGKETTRSQDTEGSSTTVGPNLQVPLVVEKFEKGPATHGKEVQNLDALETVHTLNQHFKLGVRWFNFCY